MPSTIELNSFRDLRNDEMGISGRSIVDKAASDRSERGIMLSSASLAAFCAASKVVWSRKLAWFRSSSWSEVSDGTSCGGVSTTMGGGGENWAVLLFWVAFCSRITYQNHKKYIVTGSVLGTRRTYIFFRIYWWSFGRIAGFLEFDWNNVVLHSIELRFRLGYRCLREQDMNTDYTW